MTDTDPMRTPHLAAGIRRSRWAAVAAFAFVGGLPVEAMAVGNMSRQLHLRLEGYAGPPKDRKVEEADLSLRCGARPARFQVTKARVLMGDRAAADVLDELRPQRPNLVVYGPPELVARLCDAAAGTPLTVIGQHRGGSNDLTLLSVEPQETSGE